VLELQLFIQHKSCNSFILFNQFYNFSNLHRNKFSTVARIYKYWKTEANVVNSSYKLENHCNEMLWNYEFLLHILSSIFSQGDCFEMLQIILFENFVFWLEFEHVKCAGANFIY